MDREEFGFDPWLSLSGSDLVRRPKLHLELRVTVAGHAVEIFNYGFPVVLIHAQGNLQLLKSLCAPSGFLACLGVNGFRIGVLNEDPPPSVRALGDRRRRDEFLVSEIVNPGGSPRQ